MSYLNVFVIFLNCFFLVSQTDTSSTLKFKPSKWETVDPDVVEAQGIQINC